MQVQGEPQNKARLLELRRAILSCGDFLLPYSLKTELPKRDIIECMVMVAGICDTFSSG